MEGGVTFRVYDDKGRQVFEKGATIEGDKAEAEWTYHWNGEKLEEKPKFTFEVTGQRCKRVESGECEIGMEIHKVLQFEDGEPMSDEPYTIILSNGDNITGNADSEGIISIEDLIPGKYDIFTGENEDE